MVLKVWPLHQQHHLTPKFSGATPDPLNQTWGRGGNLLTSAPGDSDARRSLRTTALVERALSGIEVRSTVHFTHFATSDCLCFLF